MANNNFSDLNEQQRQQLKQIALARARLMPDDLNISIGGTNLAKQELIEHIEQEDKIGEQLMLVDLNFLRDLASGSLYNNA